MMTYQVSDTALRDPQIRRSVLTHAVLSYVFGVVIVAGSVNLISGLSANSARPRPPRTGRPAGTGGPGRCREGDNAQLVRAMAR